MIRILLVIVAVLAAAPAEARHRVSHRQPIPPVQAWNPFQEFNPFSGARSISVRMHRVGRAVSTAIATLLPHPAGCPRRAFCGCGAAAELGLRDQSLWLAANWYRFPRATPASGMAAVRPHHVFVLKEHVEGSTWIVADYNSGGHLSRLHARSIAGYTIVAPHS